MHSLRHQPHAQCRADTTDRVKAWMRIGSERLIESFAGQPGLLGDLAHTPRTGNVTQRCCQHSTYASLARSVCASRTLRRQRV